MPNLRPVHTPLSRSKTAALSRVLDCVPKGYEYYVSGQVRAAKLGALVRKFHERYGIACTPAQRLTRKQHGLASAVLALCWLEGMEQVDWILLATQGGGPIWEQESLVSVTRSPLIWLGYELIRLPARGGIHWTWRRPKAEMQELYALLSEQLNQYHTTAVAETLTRISRQPGFAGVRKQSWALCQFAHQMGYPGELPFLYHLQKVPHGEPLYVETAGVPHFTS